MFEKVAILVSAMLMSAATCAAPPKVGETVQLHGKFALRGSEPMVYPVIYDRTGVWKLEGVAKDDAKRLQNQLVCVTGTVAADSQFTPAVQVQSLMDDEQDARPDESANPRN